VSELLPVYLTEDTGLQAAPPLSSPRG